MGRRKTTLRKAVSSLIFVLLITSVLNSIILSHQEPNIHERIPHEYVPSDYIDHLPIIISNNTDFESQGWPGSGNETDPYVIEGLNITTTEECISIVDVTVYFEIKNCFLSSPVQLGNEGIYIYNVTHCLISDCIVEAHWVGIYLGGSDGSILANNTVVNNERGLYLGASDTCTLRNNTAYNNSEYNIYLYHSKNCFLANNTMWENGLFIDGYSRTDWVHTILNNTVNGKPVGYLVDAIGGTVDGAQYGQLILVNCSSVNVSNGVFHNASIGVLLNYCTDCTLSNNTASGGSFGFYLISSNKCILTNNTAISNSRNFYLDVSDSCQLIDNKATNDYRGFDLDWSDNCTLINNTASNSLWAFNIVSSDDCILFNNTATESRDGFYLYFSEGNTLANNTAIDNSDSFSIHSVSNILLVNNTAINSSETDYRLTYADNCTLANNTATSNSFNFNMYYSDNCILENNTVWGAGLIIKGDTQSNWLHSILGNNLNGKPLAYISNTNAIVIDGSQFSQLILVNCTNANIKNEVFDMGTVGLQIAYCTECIFTNNTITNSVENGFYLYHSDNCTLTNNTASDNSNNGFFLAGSNNCTVTNNTAMNNVHDGFYLGNSNDCTLTDNTAIGNFYGIVLESSGNRLFLNKIGPNSEENAVDNGLANTWDDNISKGNYWSDWNGIGVYQIPGSAGSVDRYPLRSLEYLFIDSPSDVLYEEGSIGHAITWTPSASLPNRFELYRNDTLIDSRDWDGSEITIRVDGLEIGVYIYTLSVYNDYEDQMSDSVLVTVVSSTTTITTTTTTTTTLTNNGSPFSIQILMMLVSSGIVIFVVVIAFFLRKR